MKVQNYSNHRRYIPGFHFVLSFLGILALAGSIFFLVKSCIYETERLASVIVFLSALNFMMLFFYARQCATKVQDRAIRAEENLRHFTLTGNLLDPRLRMSQIVDRKSTRLNSSHLVISYAVFCLTKHKRWDRRDAAALTRRDRRGAGR